MNITLVDDYLNKHIVRAKAPSEYLTPLKKDNDDFDETMESHLIDPDKFGVWDDDYDTFIDMRAKQILKELNKRLNPVI